MTETNHPANSDDKKPAHSGRRFMLDMGPLLLFFGANYLYHDLMFSIKVLVGATLIALAISWRLERRIPMMAAFGCLALVFFGGLSLYFDNELFIKIKPTVVTFLLAAAIAGGRLMGRNPLAAIMGGQMKLTDKGWGLITWLWALMFLTTGVANEIAWRVLSTDDWITFKVFGITGISLIFVVISVPLLQKHQIED